MRCLVINTIGYNDTNNYTGRGFGSGHDTDNCAYLGSSGGVPRACYGYSRSGFTNGNGLGNTTTTIKAMLSTVVVRQLTTTF